MRNYESHQRYTIEKHIKEIEKIINDLSPDYCPLTIMKKANAEEKDVFWENICCPVCKSFIDFKSDKCPLLEIGIEKTKSKIKSTIERDKEERAQMLKQYMDDLYKSNKNFEGKSLLEIEEEINNTKDTLYAIKELMED
jgi:hypothetical protein